MLKATRVADTASANQLVKLWAARYLPDLSGLPAQKGLFPVTQMIEAASAEGRAKTVRDVRRSLRFNCELAVFRTYALFTNNTDSLAEARNLAEDLERVYETILAIYLKQPDPCDFLKFIDSSSELFRRLAMPALALPPINQLADQLEAALLQLQQRNLASKDPRMVGFITTQFSFSTKKILESLTVYEQILLKPYFKFIQEQVCMPWQRVCAVAANYPTHSSALILVKQLLPVSHEISTLVYAQAAQQFVHHRSRRGLIADPDVSASTIRDLNMFQGYLWLCLLEKNMATVEKELLPLCQAVMPSLGIKWELVEQMLQLLVTEIQFKLSSEQTALFLPYARSLQKLFALSERQAVFQA